MILLAVGGLTCRGLAQAADGVTIECSLSRTRITVGDQVDFQIQVLHPDNYQIGSLPSALDFGKLEILDHRVQNTPPVDGLATTLFLFRMTAFEVGDLVTPEILISYSSDDEAERQELSCSPISLQVETVLPEDAEDLQDIKLPLDVPADSLSWWIWALLAVLAAGLAFWFWSRRKIKQETIPGPAVPSLPAYDEAIAALRRLEEQKLPRQGETKRHYVELSEIVRRYIERRFGVVASEMTARQILEQLRSQAGPDDYCGELDGVLQECDLVKFAKLEPPLERNQVLLELARNWLEKTRPVPVAGAGIASLEAKP